MSTGAKMTPAEAIEVLKKGRLAIKAFFGQKGESDGFQDCIDTLEQHIASQPRTMLGRDVPDEHIGRKWYVPSEKVGAVLQRNKRKTFIDHPDDEWGVIDLDDDYVFGPLPECKQ